jgi:hypothetical protein
VTGGKPDSRFEHAMIKPFYIQNPAGDSKNIRLVKVDFTRPKRVVCTLRGFADMLWIRRHREHGEKRFLISGISAVIFF